MSRGRVSQSKAFIIHDLLRDERDIPPRATEMPAANPYRTSSVRAWMLLLPYGKWTCITGREVLFNRSYWPIWERAGPDAPVSPACPGKWVEGIVKSEHYYDDYTSPRRNAETRRLCRRVLKQWGVPATSWADCYQADNTAQANAETS
jgi:hypothetical protein